MHHASLGMQAATHLVVDVELLHLCLLGIADERSQVAAIRLALLLRSGLVHEGQVELEGVACRLGGIGGDSLPEGRVKSCTQGSTGGEAAASKACLVNMLVRWHFEGVVVQPVQQLLCLRTGSYVAEAAASQRRPQQRGILGRAAGSYVSSCRGTRACLCSARRPSPRRA